MPVPISWLSAILFHGCGTDQPAVKPDILLKDEENYSAASVLHGQNVVIAPETTLSIGWSAVQHDMYCAPADPADIMAVALMYFEAMTCDGFWSSINGDIQQQDLTHYLDHEIPVGERERTQMTSDDLTYFGAPVAPGFPAGSGALVLAVQTDPEPLMGIRSMTCLLPTDGEVNTDVQVPDPCGMLEVSADLESGAAIRPPADHSGVVDWSALTLDGRGEPLDAEEIDLLTIWHFTDRTLASLEADVLAFDRSADGRWSVDVPTEVDADSRTAWRAQRVDLAGLTGDSAFPGFSADGVWLIGLRCSTCWTQVPLFIGVVETE